MTQRSPFVGIDSRMALRFYGGRDDALIAGSNCELANTLTLIRRPGFSALSGGNFPDVPVGFYSWQTYSAGMFLVGDGNAGVYLLLNGSWQKIASKTSSSPTTFVVLGSALYMASATSFTKIFAGTSAPSVSAQGTAGTTSYAYSVVARFTSDVTNSLGIGIPSPATIINDGNATLSASNYNLISWNEVPDAVSYDVYRVSGGASEGKIGNVLSPALTFSDTGISASGTEPTLPSTDIVGIQPPNNAPTLVFTQQGTAWKASEDVTTSSVIVDSNGGIEDCTTAGTTGTTPPTWPTNMGATVTDGSAVWTMKGSQPLSPIQGYQYYYCFTNSATQNNSGVSPLSATTGPMAGFAVTVSGSGSTDPQVDTISIFRNTDGGGIYYLLAQIPNTTTWSYEDLIPDTGLDTGVFAPVAELNHIPPTGVNGIVWWGSRMWGFVGNNLYCSTGPDNAALLNVVFNGVTAECWIPTNQFAFDAPITRLFVTQVGLLVWTTKDIWLLSGTTVGNYASQLLLAGMGLRNFYAADIDGETIFAYTADRQLLAISVSSGATELGFAIGDVLETTFDPTVSRVSRHVSGSRDNAVYVANGSTGWYRLTPAVPGDGTPAWSPLATFAGTGGCGFVQSVETSPGVKQLLLGTTVANQPIYARNLSVFSDGGTTYAWSATVGSLLLANPGMLAEVESITLDASASGTAPTLSVILDEIGGSFVPLPDFVNDPPQLNASVSLYSQRFYLQAASSKLPQLCRHMQVQVGGPAADTPDEVYGITVRGALLPEQS